MKRCRKIQKEMERYLDGELPSEKLFTFENHLKTCSKCRQLLERKREERRMRITALIPNEIPLSTEDILSTIQNRLPQRPPAADVIPLKSLPWWVKIKKIATHPAPAIAFALCLIALGLSFFLPFGTQKTRVEPGIVIEQIESSGSVMIFQPNQTNTTLIWIVPTHENEEAT